MAELSPAAQAVLDAWLSSERGERMLGDPACLAAALRAAADQVVPDDPNEAMYFTTEAIRLNRMSIRAELLAIAAELEGAA